jgi:hypothetical protein
VPLRGWRVVERTGMVTPCFSTIYFVTQSPNPVPSSPFGVKNGSNTPANWGLAILLPLSATLILMHRLPSA